MSVIRNTSVTNTVLLVNSAMATMMQDDDKTDVFVGFLSDGIRFSSWSGVASVEVYPVRNSCGETIKCVFTDIDKDFKTDGFYALTDVFHMCKNIYDFIQTNSRNGQ